MDSPNILITNYCNQSCRFCFASKEMRRKSNEVPFIIFDQFKKIASKVSKKYSFIRLMGGEPLIHPEVAKILLYASIHFSHVQIFTNGLFSDMISELVRSLSNIQLIINCSTPAYQGNKEARLKIINNIQQIGAAACSISITLQKGDDGLEIARNILQDMPFINDFRVGIANPIVGIRNPDPFPMLRIFGVQLVSFVKEIRRISPKARIVFNCGFVRCMFQANEYEFIKKNVSLFGLGCFGKQASFDLGSDKKAFYCFPLSDDKSNFDKRSLSNISNSLLLGHYRRWKNYQYDKCMSCKYHGFDVNKCPGPCLGLRGNG